MPDGSLPHLQIREGLLKTLDEVGFVFIFCCCLSHVICLSIHFGRTRTRTGTRNRTRTDLISLSLRSWRYCLGARFKFWRQSRDPQKGVGTRRSRGFRRQISRDYYTIPPTTSRKTGSAPGYTKFSNNHKIQTSKVSRFLGRSH